MGVITSSLTSSFDLNGPVIATNSSGVGTVDSSILNSSIVSSTTVSATNSNTNDFRIRIAYLSGATSQYTGILSPLTATNGMMFPYTPSISNVQDVNYQEMSFTHSNTDYYAYTKTPNVKINIAGKFTIQNQSEGLYALAAIHFCRSVSKMYFGQTDPNAGIPPPILSLNGYGTYMYNQLRCFVNTHSWSYDEGVDLINVQSTNGNVYLPVIFTLNVNLVIQNTTRAQRLDFSLEDFKSGALLQNPPNGSGWI